ncbi:transcriptional regulator FtrA [Jeongeupia chitinilytica]|uniref:Transcriptional activator FtrA n=1 Tax=Jeongeupia chitinilytica TaxID=1041641 RepID=A0ABQ3H6S1_9NEIS|nr:transcriptional regulator FtrA [Jeongeupia chitinilytica]GHD68861.1 transcriptional activator FtrA [Jeongeupia chitinilytica]
MSAPLRVVALAYDGLCTFEFGCVVEVFGLARPELSVPWYTLRVAAIEAGPLRAMGGIAVSVDAGLEAMLDADLVILPGWRGADAPPPAALLDALCAAHARGARIATICSGSFVLAASGLLDGRRATTHWRYAEKFAARHPAIAVQPDVLYVDEGRLLTSAGSAAGLDMMLHIVRSDYGAEVANSVARRLVIPPHRDGGQQQYIERPLPRFDNNRLAQTMDWMRARAVEPLTLAQMAGHAAMSPRTFLRQFRDATGATPYDWLLRERVGIARHLLETGDIDLTRLAQASGFGSVESLRAHFRRVVGVAPSVYRRRFAVA